ncbi:MAG: 4Fe-4S binding protein, partial [Chloroflexi bacterium]|nr:4Fe-4S binding protein [Chloroflexota bacterium]
HKAIVVEDNGIGSGCELCIQICPFDALELGDLKMDPANIKLFFAS